MKNRNVINDRLLIEALDEKSKAWLIIRCFYDHSIDLSNPSDSLQLNVLTNSQVCDIILRLLLKTKCRDIIGIIKQDFDSFKINKSDICQFSSFDDCYYRVIDLIIRSGIEGVSWERMGFMLRSKPRTTVADTKYGENHGKTAVMMGLCRMDNKHKFITTAFGDSFNKLSKSDKVNLKAKICLYIPIIQNYFANDNGDSLMDEYFKSLSESTQKRRRPNINYLIQLVKEDIK
ncbi:MAG: hypothetical protein KBT06_10150 [Prevotellaceae bacterium]|nr:hypothetical protein [Candidatus Colivivens equi]